MLTYRITNNKMPVFTSEYFIGRRNTLKYIFDNINDLHFYNSLAIIGELGTGKTSLLNMLFLPELQKQYKLTNNVVLANVGSLDGSKSSIDFYKYIGAGLLDGIKKNLDLETTHISELEVLINELYNLSDDFSLGRKLNEILQYLYTLNKKVVFILDDFDKTVESTNLDYTNFLYLRSLASQRTQMNVMYIISARKNVEFISEAARTSGFNNIFHSHLPFNPTFNQEEVEEYVKKFLKDKSIIDETLIKKVAKLSGNIPELVRSTCNYISQNDKSSDLNHLIEQIIKIESAYLNRLFISLEWEFKVFLNKHKYKDFEYKDAVAILKGLELIQTNNGKNIVSSQILYEFVMGKQKRTEYILVESDSLNKIEPQSFSGLKILENFLIDILGHYKNRSINQPLVLEELNDLNKRVEILDEEFQTLQSDVLIVKKDFKQLGQMYLSPENDDIEEYADKLKSQTTLLFKDDNIEIFKEQFPSSINKIWNNLRKNSREFLLIGEYLRKILGSFDIDFAPISICYCRAFEIEINAKLLPVIREVLPNLRINGTPLKSHRIKTMTIGQFKKALSTKEKELRKALQDNFGAKNIDLITLTNKIECVRKIRNDTAHARAIYKKNVNDLRNYILGTDGEKGLLEKMLLLRQ